MLKMEPRTCKKCKKPFIWTGGGIVANPRDAITKDLCPDCREKDPVAKILLGESREDEDTEVKKTDRKPWK